MTAASQASVRTTCQTRTAPVLCEIHHWRNKVWTIQDRLGATRTPYRWTAERTVSAAYKLWVRHLWHARWGTWNHRMHVATAAPWTQSWLQAALCVHSGEGAWNDNTGNGFYGGMQFDYGTWLSNGGGQFAPYAYLATPKEQLLIAFRTWQARGWAPWPNTAAACGLL